MYVTQRLRRPLLNHIAGFALPWVQALAEQREQRVKELEERVKAEKDAREAAVARANQVRHNREMKQRQPVQAHCSSACARLLSGCNSHTGLSLKISPAGTGCAHELRLRGGILNRCACT